MERWLNEFLYDRAYLDHHGLIEAVHTLTDRYPTIGYDYLGNSLLGRSLPLLTLGNGPRRVLYVGAHHGMEWVTSIVLLRFAAELGDWLERGTTRERISPSIFFETHTVYIVPMLNPDGVEYQLHGVSEQNPLRLRAIRMNGGSEDFSHWQANARGVDLNHNYDAEFEDYRRTAARSGILSGAPTRYAGEWAESEPEVASLCNFIRYHEDLRGVITLHTQGEEIFCGKSFHPQITAVAHRLAQLCGYRLSTASGLSSMSGLTDFCADSLALPAFTLECGKGENPLPVSDARRIYTAIRRALLLFPTLL